VRVLPFGVSRNRLEGAIRATGAPVEIVDEIGEADALLTLRSYYRSKPGAVREAEERALPIYVMKANTSFQMEQALLQIRPGGPGLDSARRDPLAEVYRATEDAIARVMGEGRPVELPPANSYIRRLQHQLAGRYNLDSRSSGRDPNRRVRIMPVGGPGGPVLGR
jgi:hypothetical protein